MPQLAKLIRQKYPGEYDDLDDATLEDLVIKKYPEYEDLRTPKQEANATPLLPGTPQEVDLTGRLPVSRPSPYGLSDQDFRQKSVVEQPTWPKQKVLPDPRTIGTIGPTPKKFMGGVFEPPMAVTEFTSDLANKITDPNFTGPISRALPGLGGPGVSEQFVPQAAGMAAGMIQGAGQQLSPGNLLLAGAGAGEIAAMRQFKALRDIGNMAGAEQWLKLARGLELTGKAGAVPIGLHGASEVAQGGYNFDPARVGGGLIELAGAGLAMRPRVNPLLEHIERTPQAVSAPQTGDINLSQDVSGRFTPRDLGEQMIRPESTAPEAPIRPHINDILNTPIGQALDHLGIDTGPPPLDPRITGLAPESQNIPAPQDEFGNQIAEFAGPQLEASGMGVPGAINVADEINKIQAARGAAKAEVDAQELLKFADPSIWTGPNKQRVLMDAEGNLISKDTGEVFNAPEDPMEPQFSRVQRQPTASPIEMAMRERTEAIRQEIDNAYRTGNTDQVVQLSRELAEINYALGGGRPGTRPYQRPSLEMMEEPDPMDPQFARAKQGGITIGADIRRSAGELTTGYSGALPGIMMREAMQNAIDAVRHLGIAGNLQVTSDSEAGTFEIVDNGRGMTLDELYTVFSDLHSSGKVTDTGATGGKGVGKASYMLGGQHFFVETTAKQGDQIIKTTVQGTPDEFLDPEVGVNPIQTVMPPGTPTGTIIRTKVGADDDLWSARANFYNILKYSRGIDANVKSSLYGKDNYGKKKGIGYTHTPNLWESKTNPPFEVAKTDFGTADATLYLDTKLPTASVQGFNVQVLNNGMWQFSYYHNLSEETPGMPNEVIIDIAPKVEEGTTEYPFPVQRESMKDEFKASIDKFIDEKLVNPFASKKKAKLKEIYDNLTPIPLSTPKFNVSAPGIKVMGGSGKGKFNSPFSNQGKPRFREAVIFDPGDRLTAAEKSMFINNASTQAFVDLVDTMIEETLQKLGDPLAIKKLEKIGIVLDPGMHGVHIPNPTSPRDDPKSMILINPFIAIDKHSNPYNAAIENVVTINHEEAHIQPESPGTFNTISPNDMRDPRVGEFLQTYMREVVEATGNDSGHGVGFIKRLGKIYAAQGPDNGLKFVDALTALYETEPDGYRGHGSYGRDIQELLQIYTESRGRDAVTEDFLSGTGIKSKATGGGKEGVSGATSGHGEGTNRVKPARVALKPKANTEENRRRLIALGYEATGRSNQEGHPIWTFKGEGPRFLHPGDEGWGLEAWNIPRGAMSVDLPFATSAALRQATGMIANNPMAWLRSWKNAAIAYGDEHAFQEMMAKIGNSPNFQEREGERGARLPSFADEAGIKLTGLGNLNNREEALQSNWMEKFPIYGRHVRGSNRAFTAFLNTLRADSFNKAVDQYNNDQLEKRALQMMRGQSGTYESTGEQTQPQTLQENMHVAKQVGEAIMTLTGRGPLRLDLPGGRSLDLEKELAAKILTHTFFSPRLFASRIALFNVFTYSNADPFVRSMYIKGMLGAMGLWIGAAALAEMAGAEVNKDPNNADFYKIKVGNTRFDAGSGFQQLLVLASRMRPQMIPFTDIPAAIPFDIPTLPFGEMVSDPGGGKWTSSTSGHSEVFGQEYGSETRYTKGLEFLENKLHPNLAFMVGLFNARRKRPFYLLDRTLQLITPMMVGDINDVIEGDPSLLLPVTITGGVGLGASTYERGEPKPQITPLADKMGIPLTYSDKKIGVW